MAMTSEGWYPQGDELAPGDLVTYIFQDGFRTGFLKHPVEVRTSAGMTPGWRIRLGGSLEIDRPTVELTGLWTNRQK